MARPRTKTYFVSPPGTRASKLHPGGMAGSVAPFGRVVNQTCGRGLAGTAVGSAAQRIGRFRWIDRSLPPAEMTFRAPGSVT